MGKDFERELQNLDLIYQGAFAGNIEVLTDFLQKYIHLPFLGVGSGGSLSVAHSIFLNTFVPKAGESRFSNG